MLVDDFQFSGPLPEPIDQEAWAGMNTRLQTAFPDLDDHFKVIGAQGEVVTAAMQLSGTHSGSFDLRTMDMGVIPAWFVEPTRGADLKSIRDQLGIKSERVMSSMAAELFVGNLSRSTTREELNALFARTGDMTAADGVKDRKSGESKGYAFVTMSAQNEAVRPSACSTGIH